MKNTATVAIIGVAHGQKQLCLKAKEMGLRTIAFGWKDGAECLDLIDVHYPISIKDTDAIVEICRKENVKGVVSNASNLTAEVTAKVSDTLGLPGNKPDVLAQIMDKYHVRNATADIKGLNQIKYSIINDVDLINGLEYPCIVKPVEGFGKYGVSFVHDEKEFQTAVRYALEYGCDRILVEEFIKGREISVESISQNGVHYVLQITDKENTGAPHFVEIAHHQPSNLSEDIKSQIKQIVVEVLSAINYQCGASHIELKVNPSGIYLIEVNPRGGGDEISNQLVLTSTGIDYVKLMIDAAMGKDLNIASIKTPKTPKYAGIYFLCWQTRNRLDFITKSDNEPWFYTKNISEKPLIESKENGDRNGYMMYVSDHRIKPTNEFE